MEPNHTDMLGYGLYAIAYGTSILAFLMTRINWLRVLFILSSACYALYYYIFPAEPLWLDVVTEGAFVAVNLLMLCFVFWAGKRIKFTQPEKHLFDTSFSSLQAHEFNKVLKISSWLALEPRTHITKKDKSCEFVYYLFSGSVEVSTDAGPAITRHAGSVIGEVSFMLETHATANVVAIDTIVLLAMPQARLRKLCKSNERIGSAVESLLSAQMATKLADNAV